MANVLIVMTNFLKDCPSTMLLNMVRPVLRRVLPRITCVYYIAKSQSIKFNVVGFCLDGTDFVFWTCTFSMSKCCLCWFYMANFESSVITFWSCCLTLRLLEQIMYGPLDFMCHESFNGSPLYHLASICHLILPLSYDLHTQTYDYFEHIRSLAP
jgi:hypothetical protein